MTDKELFDEMRKKNILKMDINGYRQIRHVFDTDYRINELSNIKRRIEYCIIFGEYLSAMLTTNYLLEYFCKITLIYNFEKRNREKDFNIDSYPFALTEELIFPTELYDEKNLHNNLEKMKKEKLIDEEEFTQLNYFKEKFRNTLSHANRKKLYENAETPIEAITIENSKFVSKGMKYEKLYLLPFADFIFLDNFSKQNSIPYFLELDQIIKNVVIRIMPKTNDQK